jgi:DNA-binding NarL/FixJ family response regulator
MQCTVFIVDDHQVVRQGIRSALAGLRSSSVVGEAADGLDALRQIERLLPDIVILDLSMPGLSGLEALRIIRQRSPQTRVVVLSVHDGEAFVSEALQCGAMAYVRKGGDIDDIRTAVREVSQGRHFLSAPLSDKPLESYLANKKSEEDAYEMLTPREREVFQLAAQGNTCPRIAGLLHISERTVEMHRARLMSKLELGSQTELVVYAVRRGIISDS